MGSNRGLLLDPDNIKPRKQRAAIWFYQEKYFEARGGQAVLAERVERAVAQGKENRAAVLSERVKLLTEWLEGESEAVKAEIQLAYEAWMPAEEERVKQEKAKLTVQDGTADRRKK